MANTRAGTPKGTRDFSPAEMMRRNFIFDTIEGVFKTYGFLPIETPAMENLSTLTGKYGEEGDRLIFKVLNSGDAWRKVSPQIKSQLAGGDTVSPGKLASELSDKALRYDLTVPFARYVVQHQNEIVFPFKRYQIQSVWRADRPQKGRYREFTQCDADIIGSKSLLNEVDLIGIFESVFGKLNMPVEVLINDRKILSGLAEISGQPDKVIDIVTALDKLDKIGRDKVEEEMLARGISESSIGKLAPLFNLEGGSEHKLDAMADVLGGSEIGLRGIEDIRWIMARTAELELNSAVLAFDPTLARGLDYYTGAIFEVKALEGSLKSSICGGGRYDDLTGVFGLPGLSGVGISFGADRIHDVLLEAGKFPESLVKGATILFANFGPDEALFCLQQVHELRGKGISAELYPDEAKMKKQFKYADDKNIRYVAMIGEEELKSGVITIKDMSTGEQKAVKPEELSTMLA
jgi:histidyl-tRNA synthetase